MSDKLVYQESTVRGFHGTDLSVAVNIMRSGYIPGASQNSYLGRGVYFFEDQLPQAKKWAKKKNQGTNEESRKIAVLLSKIRWGYCLNLTDSDCLKRVMDFKIAAEIKAHRKISLAVAVDIAAQQLKADTIRAIRTPRSAELDDLRFSADSELILSVVNIENIGETSIYWNGSAA